MDDNAGKQPAAVEAAGATAPPAVLRADTVSYRDAFDWFEKHRPTYERLARAVAPYVDPNGTVLDIGANIGYFTKVLGEALGLTGTVHLFEPVPNLAALCRITVAELPFEAVVHEYGLSDEDAEIEIFTARGGNLGWNTIIAERAKGMAASRIQVRKFQPEELGGAIPSFVKIDVEGAESRVLGGMLDAIKNWSPRPTILCEIGWGQRHPQWQEELAVFTRVLDLGYQVIDLTGEPLDITKLTKTTDVIFVPEGTVPVPPTPRTTKSGESMLVGQLEPYLDDRGNSIVYGGARKPECRVKFTGSNNRLEVADGAYLRDTVIDFDCDNGLVRIGANHRRPPLRAHIRVGQDGKVLVGENVSATTPCAMSAAEGAVITVGEDVMFASDNALRADDGHPIFDVRTGKRVNTSRQITIGAHVWLGKAAAVLGGVTIGDGSVIGYGSVVTKDVPNNCVAAGVPARVVRRDIAWERPHLTLDKPYYKPDVSTVRKSPYWHLTATPGETPKKPFRYRPARVRAALLRRARRLRNRVYRAKRK